MTSVPERIPIALEGHVGNDYWDGFYAVRHPDIEAPSSFAIACLPVIPSDATVFELGCGNGRDALFFAAAGRRVVAIDRSASAIEYVRSRAAIMALALPPRLVAADFSDLAGTWVNEIDVVYSRFTMHAVPESVADGMLAWAQKALRPGGRLLIEARSVLGALYGVGSPAGRDAFIHDGHFRRFIRRDELERSVLDLGFEIESSVESDGLARHLDDDPVVIRLIARRPAVGAPSTPSRTDA
jgi:SAM-dependent methyltransferase